MSSSNLIKRLLGASVGGVLAVGLFVAPAQAASTAVSGCGSSSVAPLAAQWATRFNSDQGSYAVAYGAASDPLHAFAATANGACAFDASDFTLVNVPVTAEQAGFTAGVLQLPWALSATDVVYHVPGIGEGLKLTAPVLVGIYSGQILYWDSSLIQDLNRVRRTKRVHGKEHTYYVDTPKLPHVPITTIYQSDYSGDTFNLANYLDTAAPSSWQASDPGSNGPSGIWPWTPRSGEISASDAAELVADVTDAEYSIGYAANPLVFGLASGIDVARLRNAAGNYEFPALGNITDAAASRLTIPPQGDGFQYLITWPSAAYRTAYPVSYYSYGIVPENPSGPPAYQPAGVSAFVSWILSSAGQAVGADLGFAPLPSTVINYDLDLLNALP